MKKKTIFLISLINSTFIFAQVGVNTETQKAKMDVVGKATNPAILDGIIAPRITGNQLRTKNYTPTQTGALIYVTAHCN